MKKALCMMSIAVVIASTASAKSYKTKEDSAAIQGKINQITVTDQKMPAGCKKLEPVQSYGRDAQDAIKKLKKQAFNLGANSIIDMHGELVENQPNTSVSTSVTQALVTGMFNSSKPKTMVVGWAASCK
jgi:uncharacterized protein YbjQ (UPF0145 family)